MCFSFSLINKRAFFILKIKLSFEVITIFSLVQLCFFFLYLFFFFFYPLYLRIDSFTCFYPFHDIQAFNGSLYPPFGFPFCNCGSGVTATSKESAPIWLLFGLTLLTLHSSEIQSIKSINIST